MSVLPDEDERTIFLPEASAAPLTQPGVSRHGRARGELPAGTLLNNIYSVRRFLARGGMGEVYEGVNVNTDERVAIKVMLPHLAADPKVQAMFRKEARILTELAHPALVRYRVLAHEPQLDLFYIVTEFIDGRSLSDLLGELKPSTGALTGLIRRLAEGLAAAHRLGAVHRDMSPDNVLLPQDRLDHAKIIDFGIARETSLAHQTVVGDGFAGKLGYVAPEQFGDFGRRIGPWTDIYSLGLVALAVASAKAPDMGVTLVDAVDRRREGVDFSSVPATLKPVFEKMLAPDPSNRFQTMEEVIDALDARMAPAAAVPPVLPVAAEAPSPVTPPPIPAAEAGATEADETEAVAAEVAGPRSKRWAYAAVGLGVLAVLAVGASVAGRPAPKAGPLQSVVAIAPTPPEPPPSAIESVPPAAQAGPEPAPEVPVQTAAARKGPAVAAAKAPRPKAAPAAQVVARASAPALEQIARPTPIVIPHAAVTVPAESASTAAAAPAAEKGVDACWRAADGGWSFIGYASRTSCVAQAFNSCPVVHGRWGKTQLRRYNGKLQAKGTGILAKWQSVGSSQCPAQ